MSSNEPDKNMMSSSELFVYEMVERKTKPLKERIIELENEIEVHLDHIEKLKHYILLLEKEKYEI